MRDRSETHFGERTLLNAPVTSPDPNTFRCLGEATRRAAARFAAPPSRAPEQTATPFERSHA